tara:strand:+ start:303 stop:1919 length:1617 start_codon:yes stop_codon:yes gene_type:complete
MTIEPFWYESRDSNRATYSIDRTKLIDFLSSNGFGMFKEGTRRTETGSLILIDDGIVRSYSKKNMRQWVHEFLQDLDCDEGRNGRQALHRFRDFQDELTTVLPTYGQNHLPTDKWVKKLDFVQDDKSICRFPFQNGVVVISTDDVSLQPLETLKPKLIWESQIIPRDITLDESHLDPSDEGQFGQFVSQSMKLGLNGSKDEKYVSRLRSLQTSIGYLVHRFNDPTRSKCVIFVDYESSPDSVEGRNGKSIIGLAIEQMVPTQILDGRKNGSLLGTKEGKFVFDNVNPETRCLIFDDCTENFRFDGLFNIITSGMEIEKKGKQSYTIEPADKPKFLLTTNYILPSVGTSYLARQHIVEFGSYWNLQYHKGVEPFDELGKILFDRYQWDDKDWNQFYNYIFSCTQLFLKNGLVEGSLDSYRRKQIKILVEGYREFGFVDWIDSWIKSDRLADSHHVGDGLTFDALYLRAQSELEEMKWSISRFKEGVWSYCRKMGYGFNDQLAYKGSTMSSRRNRKGARGNQTEWICITTPTDKTLMRQV